MGMFDTVTFHYRMPDGETCPEYQTKDLDCECAFYEISAGDVCSAGRMMPINLPKRGLTGASLCALVSAITCTLIRGSWNGSRYVRRGINAGRSCHPVTWRPGLTGFF